MLMAIDVCEERRHTIPAVVHFDGSCRVRTVTADNNSRFCNLLEAFYAVARIPVLLNTSFSVKGQPIVNTPDEAVSCFQDMKVDVLVMSDFVMEKARARYSEPRSKT